MLGIVRNRRNLVSATGFPALAPSPIAAATRFIDPDRTSPTAKTSGWLVSNGSGRAAQLSPGHAEQRAIQWVPVSSAPRKITAGSGNGAGERRAGRSVDLDPRMRQLLPGGVGAQCERPG